LPRPLLCTIFSAMMPSDLSCADARVTVIVIVFEMKHWRCNDILSILAVTELNVRLYEQTNMSDYIPSVSTAIRGVQLCI